MSTAIGVSLRQGPLPQGSTVQRLLSPGNLQQVGWNYTALFSLMRTLQGIINTLSYMTKGRQKATIHLSHEKGPEEGRFLKVDRETLEITVCLGDGLNEVSNWAPLRLAQALAAIVVDVNTMSRNCFPLRSEIANGLEAKLERGLVASQLFLTGKRKILIPDPLAFAGAYERAIQDASYTLRHYKLVVALLPSPTPNQLIEMDAYHTLLTLDESVKGVEIEEIRTNTFEAVATLAVYAVIAKSIHSPTLESHCLGLLSANFGIELARLEFLQLDLAADTLVKRFPYCSAVQIELAKKGFKHLFAIFVDVFSLYYENVEWGN
ncbi:MAG: hypothetical protein HQ596_03180 [Candidatus Saganbacteria bacterium]|nr:hypothetical protein [Candidatus Saganbacteria bacterium]